MSFLLFLCTLAALCSAFALQGIPDIFEQVLPSYGQLEPEERENHQEKHSPISSQTEILRDPEGKLVVMFRNPVRDLIAASHSWRRKRFPIMNKRRINDMLSLATGTVEQPIIDDLREFTQRPQMGAENGPARINDVKSGKKEVMWRGPPIDLSAAFPDLWENLNPIMGNPSFDKLSLTSSVKQAPMSELRPFITPLHNFPMSILRPSDDSTPTAHWQDPIDHLMDVFKSLLFPFPLHKPTSSSGPASLAPSDPWKFSIFRLKKVDPSSYSPWQPSVFQPGKADPISTGLFNPKTPSPSRSDTEPHSHNGKKRELDLQVQYTQDGIVHIKIDLDTNHLKDQSNEGASGKSSERQISENSASFDENVITATPNRRHFTQHGNNSKSAMKLADFINANSVGLVRYTKPFTPKPKPTVSTTHIKTIKPRLITAKFLQPIKPLETTSQPFRTAKPTTIKPKSVKHIVEAFGSRWAKKYQGGTPPNYLVNQVMHNFKAHPRGNDQPRTRPKMAPMVTNPPKVTTSPPNINRTITKLPQAMPKNNHHNQVPKLKLVASKSSLPFNSNPYRIPFMNNPIPFRGFSRPWNPLNPANSLINRLIPWNSAGSHNPLINRVPPWNILGSYNRPYQHRFGGLNNPLFMRHRFYPAGFSLDNDSETKTGSRTLAAKIFSTPSPSTHLKNRPKLRI